MTTMRIMSFPLVSYAPLFVSQEIGAFAQEGLDATITPHHGAWTGLIEALEDDVADVVLGNAWFAWLPQTTGRVSLLAGCVQECGSVLVAHSHAHRQPFDWSMLEGSVVSVQSDVPTPWVAFREVLRRQDVELSRVLAVVGLGTGQAIRGLESGEVDYALLHVDRAGDSRVTEVAALSDVVPRLPWSVFLAMTSRVDREVEKHESFVRAIDRGLKWLSDHTAQECAELVGSWLGNTPSAARVKLIERYAAMHAWPSSSALDTSHLDDWKAILMRWGLMGDAGDGSEPNDRATRSGSR